MPSQKIDHAGLRAERRNGGLALLDSDSDRRSCCYKSKSASKFSSCYFHPASGLGNDGRRKRLKLLPQSFNIPLPEAARSLPILRRVLVLPKQSFNEFIRHQFQALIVWFFIIENKEQALRRLAEARQRRKVFSR